MSFNPYQPTCLVATGVQVALTGTTVATTLFSYTIKAGSMGANDMLRITSIASCNSSANNKTHSVTLGGTALYATVLTSTTIAHSRIAYFVNRNAVNSQVYTSTSTNGNYGSVAPVTSSVNMAVDQSILFRGTLANAGDTFNLERATVELWRFLP